MADKPDNLIREQYPDMACDYIEYRDRIMGDLEISLAQAELINSLSVLTFKNFRIGPRKLQEDLFKLF